MTSSPTPAPQRGRPAVIDRHAVVQGALALIERVGVDGLTMKALADELGVTPMAAYRYVENKQALVELVVQEVLSRTQPTSEGTWDERLWVLMWGHFSEVSRYPGLADYLHHGAITEPGRRALETGVELLCEAGMSSDEAKLAYSDLYAYMLGRSVLRSRAADRASPPRKRRASGVPSLSELGSDEHVRHGFQALVAGLSQGV
jgi:TetR/AcrR family tetracycline transcriptional repressor